MSIDLQTRLDRAFDGLGPGLKQAARYIMDHPDAVALRSMRALAADAGVAPATLSRLARAIDCADYDEFKTGYQEQLVQRSFSARARDLQALGRDGTVADQAKAIVGNIEAAINSRTEADIDQAARLLVTARSVQVVGMLSSFSLAAYAHYVASMALPRWSLLRMQGGGFADSLYDCSSRDALLAFGSRPYARATVLACRDAAARGVKVIAITDRRSAPLARFADLVLSASADTPSFFPSVTAQTAILEALLATVLRLAGKGALQKLDDIERQRRDYKEYWDDRDENRSPAN